MEHYINASLTETATRAEVAITKPKTILPVLDRFVVDADGRSRSMKLLRSSTCNL
jgi:hypothetical protein